MSHKSDGNGWEVTCTQLFKTQWLHLSTRQKPHCVVRVLLQTGSDSSTERLKRYACNREKYKREKKIKEWSKLFVKEI